MAAIRDSRVAVSTLRIHNLSAVEDIRFEHETPMTFRRKQPPNVDPEILIQDPLSQPLRELPVRRPSLLASPSTARTSLDIAIGRTLGTGSHGTVHEVEVLQPARAYEMLGLSDLVVKVGHTVHGNSYISREAFFYEEMECLQGVCIARHYGYFEVVLPKSRRKKARTISILLLERLGNPLSKPEFAQVIPLIKEIYPEFWTLGIEHNDIKRLNVLTAPTGPHCLPSLPSPLSGKKYRFRIVDFGVTVKSNRCLKDLSATDLRFLDYLYDSIVQYNFDGNMWS